MGDRIATIEQACREMEARGIRIIRTSSLFETAPMYVTDQEPFFNGVCEVSITVLQSLTLWLELDVLTPGVDRNNNGPYDFIKHPPVN